MRKACILLRSGQEININTPENVRIVRGITGRVKRIECGESARAFIRYLSPRDVLAVLVYEDELAGEELPPAEQASASEAGADA